MSERTLHERATDLFLELCDLPAAERETRLARMSEQDPRLATVVRELLGADTGDPVALDAPAYASLDLDVLDPALADRPTVEGYRLGEKLGEGGMGVVWEAWQRSPEREVALKLVRFGPGFERYRRRFERETRVLGWLNHPAIAQVFEAGVTETPVGPQPWFAMERVHGVPLDTYVASRRLDLRARLELFVRICEGVHHAHQKGVVHRDLKPGNVLVQDDGQPKVLDFGVARVADPGDGPTTLRTVTGELIGTLSYMSPEQVRADPRGIDQRSDVYALGVLLYETVLGRRPFDLGELPLPEALRRVLEVDPPRLAQVAPGTPVDVDTIVAKAMEKDPERRYGSALELARDLQRFLRDEPVHARPASAIYQASRFVRRNRVLVGSLALVSMVLLAGIGVSSGLYVREQDARGRSEQARDEAERRLERVLATNRTFERILRAPFPDQDGRTVRMVDVLRAASLEANREFPDDPDQRAWLLWSLGQTFQGLGLDADALPMLLEAHELMEGAKVHDPRVRAALDIDLAHAHAELGEFLTAEQDLSQARAWLDSARPTVEPGVVHALWSADHDAALRQELEHAHAFLCTKDGRGEEALEHVERAQEALARRTDAGPSDAAGLLATRARVLLDAGDLDGAEAAVDEGLGLLGDGSAGGSLHLLRLQQRKVSLCLMRGRPEEGLEHSAAVVELCRRIHGPAHPFVGGAILNRGSLLLKAGRADEAEEAYGQAVEILRDGEGHELDLARARMHLGLVAVNAGRFDVAREHYDAAAELHGRLDDPGLFVGRGFLETYRAFLELESGNPLAARDHTRRALELKRQVLPEGHPQLVGDLTASVRIALELGEFEACVREAEACLELVLEQQGGGGSDAFLLVLLQAEALAGLERWEDALARFEDLRRFCEDHHPPNAWTHADVACGRAWCELQLGQEGARERFLATHDRLRGATGAAGFRLRQQEARRTILEQAR